MTPLHLAALNGNDNILEMIGKNNLNSRDYRSRKADQLLGRFSSFNLHVQSKAYQKDIKLPKALIREFKIGNFISF